MRLMHAVTDLIGETPLMQVHNIEQKLNLKARILVKLEYLNPTGSAKDRAALFMLNDFESRHIISPGATIIEPTSGNTGIGLASIGAARGYRVILTMPDTMSQERRNILKAYGAEIVLTPGALGMDGAVAKAQSLQKEIPGSVIAGQFENPANAQAHYETTAREIWQATEGEVDAFVAGIGTGGTITGNGRYLKEMNPKIQIIGIEPAASPLISKGYAGPHGLQGIGANFIPKLLEKSVMDEVMTVEDAQAYEASRLLAKTEGILTGITSGAALHAAIELAKRTEFEGKTIVALLPDSGDRYYSTPIFQ